MKKTRETRGPVRAQFYRVRGGHFAPGERSRSFTLPDTTTAEAFEIARGAFAPGDTSDAAQLERLRHVVRTVRDSLVWCRSLTGANRFAAFDRVSGELLAMIDGDDKPGGAA